ncbi:hypothetical protein J132_01319 [Termitomyces sp. J132]|nr:hypothetical protein J132_01319 [Termitomyces sp. J132]
MRFSLVALGSFLRRLLGMATPPDIPELRASGWHRKNHVQIVYNHLVMQIVNGEVDPSSCVVQKVWTLKFDDRYSHEGILAEVKWGDTVFYALIDRDWLDGKSEDLTSDTSTKVPATDSTTPDTGSTPAVTPTIPTTIPHQTTMAASPTLSRANESVESLASIDSVSSVKKSQTSQSSSPLVTKVRLGSGKGAPAADQIEFRYDAHNWSSDTNPYRKTFYQKTLELTFTTEVNLLLLLIIAHSVSLEIPTYKLFDTNCYCFRALFEKTLIRYLGEDRVQESERSNKAGTWHGLTITQEKAIRPLVDPIRDRVVDFVNDYKKKIILREEAERQRVEAERQRVEAVHRVEALERERAETARETARQVEALKREKAEAERKVRELEAALAQRGGLGNADVGSA